MSPSAEKRTEPGVADAVGLGDVVAGGALVVAGRRSWGPTADDGEPGAVVTVAASGPVQAPAARSTARHASTGAAVRRRVMTAV